jgi:hypothetical protein
MVVPGLGRVEPVPEVQHRLPHLTGVTCAAGIPAVRSTGVTGVI